MNRYKVEIGEEVIHKEYGSGTVYKITEKNVFVQFDEKQRKRRFRYPKVFEEGSMAIIERKKNVVPIPSYPDIVPTHPDLSVEDLQKLIDEEMEEAKQYTEWPDI